MLLRRESGSFQSTSSFAPLCDTYIAVNNLPRYSAVLGHFETYDFGLELETALAKALDEVPTSLTPQIITCEGNELFHLEWDNINKIMTNMHGSNVVNSTGGIMIQEVKPRFDVNVKYRTLPIYKRSTARSLKVDTPETLAPIHIYNRAGPKFPTGAMFTPPTANSEVYSKCI